LKDGWTNEPKHKNMGAPELIILIIIAAFSWWGYSAGSVRTVGGVAGLFLGLFLSLLGIIIIMLFPRLEQEQLYEPLSPADELKKYKDLLDSGAITEYEYNIQKARLLK